MPHLLFYEAGTAPTSRSVRELTSLRRHGWDITVAHLSSAAEAVAALGFQSVLLPDPPGNPFYNQLTAHGVALSEQGRQLTERINELATQLQSGESGESAELRLRLTAIRERVDALKAQVVEFQAAGNGPAEASARKHLAAATKERGVLGERIRLVEAETRAELTELKAHRTTIGAQARAIRAARRMTTPVTGGSKFGDLVRFEALWHAHTPVLATVTADVFWAADLDALPAVIWAAEAAANKPPVVYDSHELFCELEYMPELYRAGWRQLADVFIPKATAVITVCKPIARVLDEEYGANGTHVIHNLAASTPTGAGRLRLAVGIDATVPLAIHVGNISHTRNPRFAVDLLAEMPALHVAFVGAPDAGVVEDIQAHAVEWGVDDRLHFVAPVPLKELTGFISDADVSLIMLDGRRSRDALFTMPNKLFDSLSAGVPVVAPEACTAGDFVTEHQAGRLFKINAPGQLSSAVRGVLEDSTIRNRLRSRAAEFTWAEVEPKLFALVDGLVRPAEVD